MPLYPGDVPPNVVSPLLTVVALRFLSQEVNQNEEMLWRSLGDSWNLPKYGNPTHTYLISTLCTNTLVILFIYLN